jgi:hypothetical protein
MKINKFLVVVIFILAVKISFAQDKVEILLSENNKALFDNRDNFCTLLSRDSSYKRGYFKNDFIYWLDFDSDTCARKLHINSTAPLCVRDSIKYYTFIEKERFRTPSKNRLNRNFRYELTSTEKRMVHDEFIPDSFLANVGKLKIFYKNKLIIEKEFITSDFAAAKRQFDFKKFRIYKTGNTLFLYGQFVYTLQNNFEGYDMTHQITEFIDE